MAGVKGMRPALKPVRQMRDFKPYINKWFGDLRLLSVEYSRHDPKAINFVICNVICRKGHSSRISWRRMRKPHRTQCDVCRSVPIRERPRTDKGHREPAPKPTSITAAIDELEPLRKQLFYALLKSRRQVGQIDDTSLESIVNDCLIFARETTDPAQDLAELHAPIGNSRVVHSMTGYAMRNYGEKAPI